MHQHASELVLRAAPSVLLKPPTLAQDAQAWFPKSVLKESAAHSPHCSAPERLKPALQRKKSRFVLCTESTGTLPHEADAAWAVYVWSPHCSHPTFPGEPLNVPAAHAVHPVPAPA